MTKVLKETIYLLLTVEQFLVLSVGAQTAVPECIPGFPAAGFLQPHSDHTELAPTIDRSLQVIAPEMEFNCHGRITALSALVTFNRIFSTLEYQLVFQIWRPNTNSDEFNLIGSHVVTQQPQRTGSIQALENSNLTFVVLRTELFGDDQIQFQPGDVLGWFSPTRDSASALGYGVALQTNRTTRLLFKSNITRDQPCQLFSCDDQVEQIQSPIPLINVEYELSTGSPSSNLTCTPQSLPTSCMATTTHTTSPPTPPLSTVIPADLVPTYLYIIAGVVPGGLIIAIFVTIAALIMCVRCNQGKSCCPYFTKAMRSENTNPTYTTYAIPDDCIRCYQPPAKSPFQNAMFSNNTADSTHPLTPVGFMDDNMFDGHNYATTYQANGENHIYHELVQTPEPPPPLPDRTSFTGSFKKRASLRFSIQSINQQFPYTMPSTPAPSCPYLEAVPSTQTLSRLAPQTPGPRTPQDSPPSSASEVSTGKLTTRKLFHSLDDEGLRVPTAEERELYDDTRVEELYSKLYRPYSNSKSRDSRDDTFFEQSDIYWEPSQSSSELFNQLARRKYREIRRSNIRTLEALGGGHFSMVHKGIWEVPGGCIEVAVKTLKAQASEKDKVKFLQEAAIMGQFLHPNVVKLQGVVTIGKPVMIVLEIMPKGDLKNYLRSLRSVKPKPEDLPSTFLRFCREVAFGMNYLSNKGYVHRDLAARNILLTEDLTCKIADFGMARDLDVDSIYQSQGGKIPIKWTAPESLKHRQYSTASDVWSYGMLLFEIWTLGRKPYEGASTDELMSLMDSFHCQPPPPGTPYEVYRLMVQCWHPVSTDRVRFTEICTFLNSTDEMLLNWSNVDKAIGPRVTELGAPLSEGNNLYLDLQHMYSMSQLDSHSSNVSVTAV